MKAWVTKHAVRPNCCSRRCPNAGSTRIGLPSYPQLPKSLYDLQLCLPVGQLRPVTFREDSNPIAIRALPIEAR